MWQDIVVAIANVLFGYSLIFQVFKGFIEKKGFIATQTSFLTSIGLAALSVAYLSLGLYISTATALFSSALWLVLFVQRIFYKKA